MAVRKIGGPAKRRRAGKPAAARKRKGRDDYHHGDLRSSLIAATEAIILERGVDGFTLREAARRAGVSPAAPAHHFGDSQGLLSEVARLGFKDFGDALRGADKKGSSDPNERLYRQGLAYVDFALANPARFQLMFRSDRFNPAYKDLAAVAYESFQTLDNAIRALVGLKPDQEMTPEGYGALMAAWSLVHGFAHLTLVGEFDNAAHVRGGRGAILKTFLPLALRYLPRQKTT